MSTDQMTVKDTWTNKEEEKKQVTKYEMEAILVTNCSSMSEKERQFAHKIKINKCLYHNNYKHKSFPHGRESVTLCPCGNAYLDDFSQINCLLGGAWISARLLITLVLPLQPILMLPVLRVQGSAKLGGPTDGHESSSNTWPGWSKYRIRSNYKWFWIWQGLLFKVI